jgi:hypothetical protein
MRFAKRLLMGVGAAALVAILGMAIAPKAAHGVVATLVEVANTPSNPVAMLDVHNSASQIVNLMCPLTLGTCTQLLLSSPGVSNAFTVPAGRNLVINNIEISNGGQGGLTFVLLYVGSPSSTESQIFKFNTPCDGTTAELNLGPGFVLPAGASIGTFTSNACTEQLQLRGYLTSN